MPQKTSFPSTISQLKDVADSGKISNQSVRSFFTHLIADVHGNIREIDVALEAKKSSTELITASTLFKRRHKKSKKLVERTLKKIEYQPDKIESWLENSDFEVIGNNTEQATIEGLTNLIPKITPQSIGAGDMVPPQPVKIPEQKPSIEPGLSAFVTGLFYFGQFVLTLCAGFILYVLTQMIDLHLVWETVVNGTKFFVGNEEIAIEETMEDGFWNSIFIAFFPQNCNKE